MNVYEINNGYKYTASFSPFWPGPSPLSNSFFFRFVAADPNNYLIISAEFAGLTFNTSSLTLTHPYYDISYLGSTPKKQVGGIGINFEENMSKYLHGLADSFTYSFYIYNTLPFYNSISSYLPNLTLQDGDLTFYITRDLD